MKTLFTVIATLYAIMLAGNIYFEWPHIGGWFAAAIWFALVLIVVPTQKKQIDLWRGLSHDFMRISKEGIKLSEEILEAKEKSDTMHHLKIEGLE